MHIDILTLFPGMFTGPFNESIIDRAAKQGLVELNIHNLRNWATDKHRSTDDHPYGGGPGMVMLIEPLDLALKELNAKYSKLKSYSLLTSAKGHLFNQAKARKLASYQRLVFIAGHYEGVDERVADHLVDEEISIGEFVLTGGELPVMIMIDSIVRLLPGVLGEPESLTDESHNRQGYLEYPQYTRPENYHGWAVPEILLSGHHANITKWRQKQSKSRP